MIEHKLIDYFARFRPLTETQKEAILESMEIQTYKKGEVILREGQLARSNYFILEGCVRQYYLKDGDDITSNFYTEEDWILPSLGMESERPAIYNLECLETCQVVIGNEEKGDQLIARFPEFQELAQIILEKEIIQQQTQQAAYIRNSPEERYLNVLANEKELINRVPQYHLATYIGVKPESLSRIRKRLLNKG